MHCNSIFLLIAWLWLILRSTWAYCDYSNVAYSASQGGIVSTGSTYLSISSIQNESATGISDSSNTTHYGGFISVFALAPSLDTDGDGIVDEDDPDNDNDGLSDIEEITGTRFSPPVPTDPNNPDSDNDGMSDRQEALAGTDPTNGNSRFVVTVVQNIPEDPAFYISIPTISGRIYQAFYSDTLASSNNWLSFTANGSWTETSTTLTNHIFVDDFTTNSTGANPVSMSRFYRVKVTIP